MEAAALSGAVLVPVLYFSAAQGHGWLAIGCLLVGMGLSVSSLVESRKTETTDPVEDVP